MMETKLKEKNHKKYETLLKQIYITKMRIKKKTYLYTSLYIYKIYTHKFKHKKKRKFKLQNRKQKS